MRVLSNLMGNDTKISANCIAIKDSDNNANALDNYIKGIDNYSTSEKVIGKDTDNKNVYRRTFKGTLSNSSYTRITTDYDNTKIILKRAYGSLRKEGNGSIQIGSYVNSNWYSGIYVHEEEIQCYHGQNARGGTYDITLEFTKITD